MPSLEAVDPRMVPPNDAATDCLEILRMWFVTVAAFISSVIPSIGVTFLGKWGVAARRDSLV